MLIAPDCFTGTLTAAQAARAIADGWRRGAPHDDLTLVPLADGGTGFIDVLRAGLDGEEHLVTVTDPLGRPVPAPLLVTRDDGRTTVWIESAQAIGLHLLDAGERNPDVTSSAGLGDLLLAALDLSPSRIVVGLGGSATNDGGAGLLARLGAGSDARLTGGGAGLLNLPDDALPGLRQVRERFSGIDLVIASDVDNPLLGLQGASATFAAQKGASPQQAQDLERALGVWHDRVSKALPPPTDLMTGRARRYDREPGAGAAGGVGYALMVIGGRPRSGVDLVIDVLGVASAAAAADLVITGEGSFDWQSLHGKVVAGVAQACLEVGTPCIVLAGRVELGRRQAQNLGLSGMYAVAETPEQVEASLADPVATLTTRAARIAGTWSPRP